MAPKRLDLKGQRFGRLTVVRPSSRVTDSRETIWLCHCDCGGESNSRVSMLAKTEKLAECWRWTGTLNTNGYGTIQVKGRTTLSHRVAYEHFVGPVPVGLELDHLCKNRWCVRP